ncbi:preprotein translocase subunit SecG [Pelagibacteraceae bacterium]|nr:preprotein translocase subunit SecG [Pelagibacteraceae bacterium]
MTTLVIIQLILALALVVLVLLQGSDNDSLGLGGGTSTGMMSARGTANLLSRLTAIVAGLFMIMSIVLTITASIGSDRNVLESLPSINTEEISEEPTIPENN